MPALMRTPTDDGQIFRAPGFVIVARPTGAEIFVKSGRGFARLKGLQFEAFHGALHAAGLRHLYTDILDALWEERAYPKPVRLDVTPREVSYLWTARKASWRQIVQAVKALAGNRPSEAVLRDWP